MKNYLIAIVWSVFAVSASADEQKLVSQSRAIVKAYGERLKAELQSSLQRGGAVSAIQHCHAVVPEIGQETNQGDWQAGRTSLRVRNRLNRPDAWEHSVLQRFERDREQGVKIAEMETYRIIDRDGERYFRYMKAIPTQQLCLTCHGKNIAEPLAIELRRLYPYDQATGFETGDIRGAFTVTRKLD